MRLGRFATPCWVVSALIVLALSACASTTGYLYVTDYGSGDLDRFQYTLSGGAITGWATAGATAGSATWITGGSADPISQGIALTTTDIIVAQNGTLQTYSYAGASLGAIPGSFTDATDIAVDKTATYVYVALNSGTLEKVLISTGAVVDTVSLGNAHDVIVLPDGTILASGRTGSTGIVHYTANLVQIGSAALIANASATFAGQTLTDPTGMSYDSVHGILYVQQTLENGATGPVLAYQLNSTFTSATFVSSKSLETTDNADTFGTDIGPDGNLYMANLGSGKTDGPTLTVPTDYVNGVYLYTSGTSTTLVSSLAGYNNTGAGTTPSDNFQSPSYLEFDINVNSANEGTPEPGSLALLSGLLAAASTVKAMRERRTRSGMRRRRTLRGATPQESSLQEPA